MKKEIVRIKINKIIPNKNQPRLDFYDESIKNLAESIKENGLLQPVTVRKAGNQYELIAGERRYRACVMAGLTEVVCNLMESTDNESATLALIENIQRENLSAIEEAKAYKALLKDSGETQEQLATKLGKAQSTLANKIRLLDLSPKIQQAVSEKRITERHARALLSVEPSKRNRVLNKIIKKDMTVKDTEEYIEKLNQKEKQIYKPKPKTKGFSSNQMIVVNTIRQAIEMCKKTGIKFEVEEVETENDKRIVIKFPKEN